jgi:hypothetical protein
MTAQNLIDILKDARPEAIVQIEMCSDIMYLVQDAVTSINDDDTQYVTLFLYSEI